VNKSKRVKSVLLVTLLVVSTIFGAVGCSNQDDTSAVESSERETLKIARQFGLAYAPLTIMENKNLIEKYDSNLDVEWIQLGNTAAIREAILSDQLDIGFMGIPPYLIGAENGMNWQIFTGLSQAPLGLMTSDPNIKGLGDIRPEHKIALPQPGSIQHILLTMAAKRELDDAKAFDNQLVSLKHPDGVQMLLSDSDINLHFTSPPYVFQEKNEGMGEVISGYEAFGGPFTFIVGTLREEMTENKEITVAVNAAINEAIQFMSDNPEETLSILSEQYGIEKDLLEQYIYESGIVYSQEVLGLDSFVTFMSDEGYLTDQIKDQTLIWSE